MRRPLFPSKRATVTEREAWRVAAVTAVVGYTIGDLPEPDWLPLKIAFMLILFAVLAYFVGTHWSEKWNAKE